MITVYNSIVSFINKFNFKQVFFFGLLVIIAITFNELIRDKHSNFIIFRNATLMFWNGIHPFGQSWWDMGMNDYFLYPPLFNILFAPIAFLPICIGTFVWNLFNYTMLAYAIYKLPYIKDRIKQYILLYSLPMIATSAMSFQYNITVTYIFLFAFILMEKGKFFLAILLIMLSAFTKVYGIVELGLILFYPKILKNIAYTIIIGFLLFLIPLIKLPFVEFMPYYNHWYTAVIEHAKTDERIFESFFNIRVLFGTQSPNYTGYIQIGILLILATISIIKKDLWTNPKFRIAGLALLMSFCPLFGNSTEKHTYIMGIIAFLYWYYSIKNRDKYIKTLYWANFIVLVIMPIDLFCPPSIMRYTFNTLSLNQWIFLVTWISMFIKATFYDIRINSDSKQCAY